MPRTSKPTNSETLYAFDTARRLEHGMLCGVDEAGRGPLCGPVCCAAVVLNPNDPIEGINDSKKLSEKRRETLFEEITHRALAYKVVFISPQEIDEKNILWATMDGMAQGRVWSGSMAKELGLVDELGGLDKAIEIAAAKAGIDAYTLMNYPGKKSFWSELMATDPGNYIRMQLLDGRMKEIYRQVDMLDKLDTRDYIQARMPFELHIR